MIYDLGAPVLPLPSYNPALSWSINDILLHTSSAARGWKPLWHFWLGILPSANAFDAHIEPPGCLLPEPSVRMACCLLRRWCASFTGAGMPRKGGFKCTASTLIRCHLVLMPSLHHLNEGKSSHTRRGQKRKQSPLWFLTQVINTCLKMKAKTIKSWRITKQPAHQKPGNMSAENLHMGFSRESAINPGVNPLI